MPKFAGILEELIFESRKDNKTVAAELGISASCLTDYLKYDVLPSVSNLIKIADYFSRSTDFLLGREEDDRTLTFKICPPFSERLEFLKKHYGCTSYKIYMQAGITKSRYYDWKNGKRVPAVENVIKLAEFFDCRVDFILGRES